MTTTGPLLRLTDEQLSDMLALVKGADSVELKLTVPLEQQRTTVTVLDMDPLEAQIRQVFFFETPDLALSQAGVVARARRVQGKGDDSVVKLRPVTPDQLPPQLRASPNLVVEVDAMPGGYVCSASLKRALPLPIVRPTVGGDGTVRKLFSKEQRAFFTKHAPAGLRLDDLHVLGPINVLKLRFSPAELGRKVVAELWLYPDGTRILELSTKCLPHEAFQVAAESRLYLTKKGVETGGDQQTKTRTALEFFAGELKGS